MQRRTTSNNSSSNTIRSIPCHKESDRNISNRNNEKRPPTWKVWVIASRPHTLTASICPCIVSFGYCYRQQQQHRQQQQQQQQENEVLYTYFALWCLFCMTVQIGTNLHNDYSDYVQGADKKETRIGQVRATAQGWITPYETCCAATITLMTTFITGVVLIVISKQVSNVLLWFLVVSSVFNAFAYTAGPYPLGYIGLSHLSIAYYGFGDIFVFLYFGCVATYMLPYLMYLHHHQSNDMSSTTDEPVLQIIMHGIQIGLLATNIIVVNNLRDCTTDVLAHKRTTTVRFGTTFSKVQYCCNFIVTYLMVLLAPYITSRQQEHGQEIDYMSLLPLCTVGLVVREVRAILYKSGSDLDQHVGGAAKVQFIFCIVLTMRLLLV